MGNIINPFEWEKELNEWKAMMSDMADGVQIDLSAYEMAIPPYSPRKTCGECHNYRKITAGYHFRMGSDVIHDDFGKDMGEPWSVSDGTCGKFSRTYFLQFPRKRFESPNDIDVGLYQWAARCGTCHPGGGPLEFDRNRHRLDDYNPREAAATDGDYYGAHWDLSGALEADCLFCHLETYSYQARYEQVQAFNYRWAPTAGAGLGTINGSVAAYLGSLDNPEMERLPLPTAEYDKSLFLPDGKVRLPIKRPSDRNCLFCHDLSFVEKHGTTFGDTYSVDIHSKRGIRCIDCHPGGLHHNFAKGRSNELTLRDDLDGTAHSCEKCHTEGHLGAPKMVHKGLTPVHIEKIGCEVCHVPTLRVQSIGMVDASMGRPVTIVSSEGPWFGYREEEQTLAPLWYADIRNVIDRILARATPAEREGLKDEDGDGLPDFNTDDEITKALQELYKEDNLKGLQLVYVRKGNVKTFAQAFEAFLVYELTPDKAGITYEVFKEMPTWRPKYGDVSEWRPVYARGEDKKIHAFNNQTAVWWGHKEGDFIVPLFLREISETLDGAARDRWFKTTSSARDKAIAIAEWAVASATMSAAEKAEATEKLPQMKKQRAELKPESISAAELTKERDALFAQLVKDDNGDGKPEINTDAEIVGFAKLLTDRLSGKRFEKLGPVLVSGSKVHEVGEDGKVKSYKHPQAKPVLWSVSHNVAPRKDSLGAGGKCEECHSPESYFFYGKALMDPYDMSTAAKPIKASMIELMDYPQAAPDRTPVVVRTSQFFKWLTIITMTLLILHILADLVRRAIRKKAG
jgi:hypothetical protein